MAFLGNVEYRPDKNGTAASVKCPLVDDWIEPGECQSNQGVIDRCIPARFKVKQNWKKICEACPFRDYYPPSTRTVVFFCPFLSTVQNLPSAFFMPF